MSTPASPLPDTPQAFPQRCSTCHTELETPVACSGCHTIFTVPAGLSHFDRLGIPERFAVDLEDAERRFLVLSRELHPDFFTTRSTEEQALSLEHSAELNEAISVVRDPFRRAAYLLQRWSPQEGEERDQHMPAGFLEEMLFLREEIEDALAEPASPERDATLEQFRTDLTERRDAMIHGLDAAFAQLEAARAAGRDLAEAATMIRRTLNAARYITGTLDRLRNAGA